VSLTHVPRQNEAQRWAEASVLAFWLAYPDALDLQPSYRPPGQEAAADRFGRFGLELHVLECDLAECLNELGQSYQTLNLDAYCDRKLAEMVGVLERVRSLRDALYGALLESVSQLVQARGPETLKRHQGILDWARAWREMASG